jgi:hypothetical protein
VHQTVFLLVPLGLARLEQAFHQPELEQLVGLRAVFVVAKLLHLLADFDLLRLGLLG